MISNSAKHLLLLCDMRYIEREKRTRERSLLWGKPTFIYIDRDNSLERPPSTMSNIYVS